MAETMTATVTDIRERAARNARSVVAQGDGADALREALFFHRLAARLAIGGLLGVVVCGWLLAERLAPVLTPGLFGILALGSFCVGTVIAFGVMRFIITRTFLRPTARLVEAAERIA